MKKIYLCAFFLLFLLPSCGEDTYERIDSAIEEALIYLNNGQCDDAITILESTGFNGKHALWLKTLAASYACRAGYTTGTLVTDLLISSPTVFGSPSTLGGMTRIATSRISNDIDEEETFIDLQYAIDLLLYAGDIPSNWDPTIARRAARFSTEEASDFNSFLMYMLMAQMGKYFYYFGNVSSSGVKGSGTGSNLCLANYDNIGSIDAFLDATAPGTCNTQGLAGHPDLGASGSLSVAKMCRGVTLFNNFLVVFPGVLSSAGGSDDLSSLNGVEDAINLAKDAMVLAEPTTADVANVLSYDKCIEENSSDDDNLQYYFVYMFESLFD